MYRWIGFFLAILLGLGAGLYYGWVINPVEYINTTPNSLRIDYKTDYVLMVAEVYQSDRNIEAAARRLAQLGDEPVIIFLQEALDYGQQAGYGQSDLNLLTELRNGLQTWNPPDPTTGEERNSPPSGESAP
jgi:hypothetical protein